MRIMKNTKRLREESRRTVQEGTDGGAHWVADGGAHGVSDGGAH